MGTAPVNFVFRLYDGNIALGGNDFAVDDITVVPEPATVIGGLAAAALVGFHLIRRRKVQVPALA